MKNDQPAGHRILKVLSGGLGVLSLVIGIGVTVFAFAVVMPQLEQAKETMVQGLQAADVRLSAVESGADVFSATTEAVESGTNVVAAVPATLAQTTQTLTDAVGALSAAANTLTEIERSLGLLLPDEAFKVSSKEVRDVAREIHQTTTPLKSLQRSSKAFAEDMNDLSKNVSQLKASLPPMAQTLDTLQGRVQNLRATVAESRFPLNVAAIVAGVGLLFIALGVLSISMSAVLSTLENLRAQSTGVSGFRDREIRKTA